MFLQLIHSSSSLLIRSSISRIFIWLIFIVPILKLTRSHLIFSFMLPRLTSVTSIAPKLTVASFSLIPSSVIIIYVVYLRSSFSLLFSLILINA